MKDFSPSRIPIVGLTGGIGAGKSTVARLFARQGAAVWDADTQAKALYRTSTALREAVSEEFGEQVLTYDAAGVHVDVDRAALAERVFRNNVALKKLNELVHPAVRAEFERWYQALDTDSTPYAVREAAILYESGVHADCDFVITVEAPENIRVARVVARDSVSEEAVKERMLHQWSSKKRRQAADFILENGTDLNLLARVIRIDLELRGKRRPV